MGELSVPKYDGRSDPAAWIAKAEKIMKVKKYEKDGWHIVASFKLRGKANDWYESVEHKLIDWMQFSAQLQKRFSSKSSKGSLLKKLTSLEQKGKESLKAYNDRFNMTLSRYNHTSDYLTGHAILNLPLHEVDSAEQNDSISDQQALQLYLGSLRKSVRRHVQYSKPQTLEKAQEAAIDLDDSSDEEDTSSDLDSDHDNNSDFELDSNSSSDDSEISEKKKSKKSKKIGKILKEISERNKKKKKLINL